MLGLYDDDMPVLGSSFVEHDENFLFFKFCLTCVVAHELMLIFVCVLWLLSFIPSFLACQYHLLN